MILLNYLIGGLILKVENYEYYMSMPWFITAPQKMSRDTYYATTINFSIYYSIFNLCGAKFPCDATYALCRLFLLESDHKRLFSAQNISPVCSAVNIPAHTILFIGG